jgi:hypothetical protein
MKHKCAKHGSSLHIKACRHVRQACDAAAPLPALADQSKRLICRDCLTDDVAILLAKMDEVGDDFFDCFYRLKEMIGYWPLCTDCLFEKTGLDLRRRRPPTTVP